MATFSVKIESTSSTSAYLSGSFIGGDPDYSRARSILLNVAGRSFYIISNESHGADNTFDTEIVGLTPGTTYIWDATLCYNASGKWYPTDYKDEGEFETEGEPEELGFDITNVRVGGFDLEFYGADSYAMRVTITRLSDGIVIADTVLGIGVKGIRVPGLMPDTSHQIHVVGYGSPVVDLGTKTVKTLGLYPRPTAELTWAGETSLYFRITNPQGYECKCTLKQGDTVIGEAWQGNLNRLYPIYQNLTKNTWYSLGIYINLSERDTGGIFLDPFPAKTLGDSPVTAYIGLGGGRSPKPVNPYICINENGVLKWVPYAPNIGI